jgi:hypothetical protein
MRCRYAAILTDRFFNREQTMRVNSLLSKTTSSTATYGIGNMIGNSCINYQRKDF